MVSKYLYAKEKFIDAVHELSTSKEDIKTRLLNAYDKLRILEESDFPDELKNDWLWIEEQVTARNFCQKHGTTCEKIATKILYLESKL